MKYFAKKSNKYWVSSFTWIYFRLHMVNTFIEIKQNIFNFSSIKTIPENSGMTVECGMTGVWNDFGDCGVWNDCGVLNDWSVE